MPKFIHDCAQCKFIETRDGEDVYIHLGDHITTTVLQRYGNEGSEYKSYPLWQLLNIKDEFHNSFRRIPSQPHLPT